MLFSRQSLSIWNNKSVLKISEALNLGNKRNAVLELDVTEASKAHGFDEGEVKFE